MLEIRREGIHKKLNLIDHEAKGMFGPLTLKLERTC
jgi:hypothetical protein